MPPWRGLTAILKRLRGRPDSEHEMSFNRVAFALLALSTTFAEELNHIAVPVLIGFCAVSVLVFLHLLVNDAASAGRRALMMIVDLLMILYFMHVNDAYGAAFWPLLLWTILGNGFRFGSNYLAAGAAVSVAGFAAVIVMTPFWRNELPLSIGLLTGLVALPLYASTLIRKLSSATAAAEEASRAKSYFLASVSHELRTPLTAIIGLGAHLHSSETDSERRAMADTIVSAGRSLLGMINRLLDYSRVEARGAVAAAEPFDLLELLIAVRALMHFQAGEKGLAIDLHVMPDTPTALIGDETHLRDILVNLVGNAVKFTERGAITIVAGVECDGARDLYLRLMVIDTGIGIAEDAQRHIFGSFRQADDTIIDRYGGTGLGLAICEQLVRLMGGEIGVDSRPGEGSRFFLTVRVERDEATAAPASGEPRLLLYSDDPTLSESIGRGAVRRDEPAAMRALLDMSETSVLLVDSRTATAQGLAPDDLDAALLAKAAGGARAAILLTDVDGPRPPLDRLARIFATTVDRGADAAALDRAIAIAQRLAGGSAGAGHEARPVAARTPLRILVADDNQMNRKVFCMILGRVGHEVICADDGEAALDQMKDHSFDAVLMDVNMPVLNGVEATKLYRFAALGQRHVPIVGVTADASPATAERCLDAGMDACIAKPTDAETLLDLIDKLACRAAAPPPPVPVFDPTGVVTPLLRDAEPVTEPPVDWSSLEELEELGGADFVADLLDVYISDAETLIGALGHAVASGNVDEFRSTAHALRSSAANVGARRVAAMCLHLQRLGEDEFHRRGAHHRDTLEAELARVAAALLGRTRARAAG